MRVGSGPGMRYQKLERGSRSVGIGGIVLSCKRLSGSSRSGGGGRDDIVLLWAAKMEQ
jgi:hypothetical protein